METELNALVPIIVEEPAGIARRREPVSVGVPFPRSLLPDVGGATVEGPGERAEPAQGAVLARWPDGSVKWALFDLRVDVEPRSRRELRLSVRPEPALSRPAPAVAIVEAATGFTVDTRVARFAVDRDRFVPGWRASLDEEPVIADTHSRCILVDAVGRPHLPVVEMVSIEAAGPIRATLRIDGSFSDGATALCEFVARVSFFAGSATARLAFTVRNPRRAQHPHNHWDLGDPGSVYIRDLALQVGLSGSGLRQTAWSAELETPVTVVGDQDLEIYQDSSGGANWNSENHVNRHNRVTTSFCGYRAVAGDGRTEGHRAQPLVGVFAGDRGVAGTVECFWQNFPKAMEVSGTNLVIRLFPPQSADVHELQGGEQKTHVIHLAALRHPDELAAAAWMRAPLVAQATPEWYCGSRAIPYLAPRSDRDDKNYLSLVDAAVDGTDSFASKREIVDEYGWRHFGDIYADHERVHYTGPPPVISHYNNQYDAVYGAFLQFARTGDLRWFHMMDELASHVVDIDVYHTRDDRAAYSGGLFWHTNHYTSAFTATHRSYSRLAGPLSGGPSAAHCYTTGLMHHFFVSGDERSRETVVGLARWIVDLDDGRKHVLRWVDRGDTGDATMGERRSDPLPTRAGANAVTTLLDGFALSGERAFLQKAEALVRRSIHPADDVDALGLIDAERRWSYTMFLEALGRYLDAKRELGEIDAMYDYARESLLHYARWMAMRETPYLTRASQLEYPTETWSAQDMRKSNIFLFAAKHAGEPERERFRERSDFFYHSSVSELSSAPSRSFTRPVVLMMTLGHMHAFFDAHPDALGPASPADVTFAPRQRFVSQRDRAMAKLKRLGVVATLVPAGYLLYRFWRQPRP